MTSGDAARHRAHASRLSPPMQLTEQVARMGLLRSLEVGRTGRLTQVVGPPGSGKTVALTQWHDDLRARGVVVAWLTASVREREPSTFFSMIAQALDYAGLPMGDTGVLDTRDVEPRSAIDGILLQLDVMGAETVIIVDAFDRIETPALAGYLEELIAAAPDTAHIVLATRRRPQLTMAVLRAQGFVRTIEARELLLSALEIAELLRLPADAPEVAAIAEQTGGWAVAVELFRLWCVRTGRRTQPAPFGGQVAEVADYLTEEVFATLEPRHQQLLIDLSLFESITAELADWMRGTTDAAQSLEAVRAALPGLVERSADHLEQAYRLHPLLADYARVRLQASRGDRARLHRRAALWYSERDRHVEAISHARVAEDASLLNEILASIRPLHLFVAKGVAELRATLRTLQPASLAAHPRLRLMAALAYFKGGFFTEANGILQAVKRETQDFTRDPYGNDRKLRAEGALLELYFTIHLDQPPTGYLFADAVNAVRRIARDDPVMWAAAETVVAMFSEQVGELQEARKAILRARAIYQAHAGVEYADASLLAHEMLLELAEGSLQAAADLTATTRKAHWTRTFGAVPLSAMVRVAAAVVDFERRLSQAAGDAAQHALDQFGEFEIWFEPFAVCYAVIADVAWRRGGLPGLRECMTQARKRAQIIGLRDAGAYLSLVEGAYLLRAGEVEQASPAIALARQLRVARDDRGGLPWRLCDAADVLLTLASLAGSDSEAAIAHASALVTAGTQGRRTRTLIKGHILRAVGLGRAGHGEQAMAALERALTSAEGEGHVAVFAEEEPMIIALLRRLVDSEPSVASAAARKHASAILRTVDSVRAPGALNDREAQIMSLLVSGASNKLIGRKLDLSENTIKFHLKKIFAKLGVSSRKAAVMAFRAEGRGAP